MIWSLEQQPAYRTIPCCSTWAHNRELLLHLGTQIENSFSLAQSTSFAHKFLGHESIIMYVPDQYSKHVEISLAEHSRISKQLVNFPPHQLIQRKVSFFEAGENLHPCCNIKKYCFRQGIPNHFRTRTNFISSRMKVQHGTFVSNELSLNWRLSRHTYLLQFTLKREKIQLGKN